MQKVTPYANNLFEQPWWLDIVAENKWEEIILKDNKGQVTARMPYAINSREVFMPEMTQTMGIWLCEDVSCDIGKTKRAINDLFREIPKRKRILIRLCPENSYILPFMWLGYKIMPCFTYRIECLSDLEMIYDKFNKTAKKNIKYAKNKVEIRTETNFNNLWGLLEKTFQSQHRKNPLHRETIEHIIARCEKNHCGKYFEAVDDDGNVHSCAYFVYDDKVCYYLLGASDSQYRSSGAQSLIIWEGIKFASKNSTIFDFEGSMVEGIENFFRQFGGMCRVYYQISKQNILYDIFDILKPKIKRMIGYKV